ncbi:MAG: VOC family protein [Clostridia bacterium]|nr:VOC family protein [Clostridia bacterium]
MQPKIKGVHHIAIKGKGIEKFNELLHFYHDILGMPIARRWGTDELPVVMVDTGAGMLELFANAPDEQTGGALRHLAFAVESVDDCIEAVRAEGYQITIEPKDMLLGTADHPYPVRLGFCIGPVGEEVEFFTEK